MAVIGGLNINDDGLKIALDRDNPKCINSSGWTYNLANNYNDGIESYGFLDASLGTDFDGITACTVMFWSYVHSHHTSYSQHPFSKTSSTSTAAIQFYDFGNYLGNNNNGVIGFYANRGGSWGNLGFNYGKTVIGNYYFIGLQFNSVDGGQMWVNGSKHSGRNGTGVLGTDASNFRIYPEEYNGQNYLKIESAYVYLRELGDVEIIDFYDQTKARFGF